MSAVSPRSGNLPARFSTHREERRGAFRGARSDDPERVRTVTRPTDPEPVMRTSETLLLDFIRQTPQFLMPVNQRRYAWTRREYGQLWEHILDAGERADLREHFLGPVICLATVDPHNAHWSPYLVYDGQQRLTTVTLILEALARHVKDNAPDGFEPDQIKSEYLLNAFRKGDHHYRLVLKPGDAETLLALIHGRPMPAGRSSRILDAFAFFEKRIRQLGPDVSALCAGLRKLRIVAFDLKQGEDNPHRIFETMNACGRDLTCADMIGNFILMPLDRERQERLHADHLRPIECGFERHGEGHFDAFIRHYLTLRTGEIPKQGEEYATFKDYASSRRVQDAGPETLASDLRTCADHYRAMVLGKEPDAELARSFGELASLDMKPVWPFLLHLYDDHAGGRLSRHDLVSLTRLVTAYAVRRAVCGYKPAAPPPVFAKAPRAIDPERYVESVRAYFLSLPDGFAFPSDDAFRAELTTRNMYRFKHRDALLQRLENHGRRETVSLSSYTVEHIMPQGERLPDSWKTELGPDWAQVWQSLRHTLGNLTCTAFNSEMGNRSFREKRDAGKGFRNSPFWLNEDLREAERWDGGAIRARAARLAERAVDIWRRPVLPETVLASYGDPRAGASGYTIEHHPHIRPGAPMHDLFEAVRQHLLALGPHVREEFRRHYVAYKTHTNFVDVVPQKRRLLLTLNMRFGELDDPRGLATDITNLGLWGNGDVQVELDNERQIAYAMDLVRQAFSARQQGVTAGSRGDKPGT